MKQINFDHLAASQILPEAKEAMLPFLSEDIGNPLSKHSFGNKPRKALEESRAYLAGLINASLPEEIIFTSCGSESNNLALKGIAQAYAKKGKHIIASPIEHPSVSHPLKSLEKQGYKISWLKADGKGNVDPQEVSSLIGEDAILITVTSASNEIGTLEPIKEIGKIAREKGVIFHTDSIACAGQVPLDAKELNVDLLSMAGNVFYGPLGTGALYVRKGVRIIPLIEGGIQERGLRAGTHNLAGIIGMGIAAKIAQEKLSERREYLLNLREKLIAGTLEKIPDCFLTGEKTNRLPGHASFCIKYIEGESILLHLNMLGIAATSGSTCSSEALKVSSVLEAIGVDPIWAQGSTVFSLGIDNTSEQVELFLRELSGVVEKLRMMSPLSAADIEQFRTMKHHHEHE
ncbi:MAG: cysteine desulfurase NifS [Omnitrophica WOR_2 bacterium RIFCSPHIGHO2_02_FULL_45_21]|nr:MAG: cysteine desulfurase NifS [Omnitrophica WOR_2 bacterium RIFCSPHIGHO2_02_FULL_45_21]